jgi:hypothetical protein
MRGAEPRPEPEANGLMVITATGAIPLAGAIERTAEQHTADIQPAPTPVISPPGGGGAAPKKPAAKPAAKADDESVKKKVAEAPAISPVPHTPSLALAKTKLYSHVAHFLFEAGKKAATVKVEKRLRKATNPTPDDIDQLVTAALGAVNWEELVGLTEPEIEAAAIEGARVGLAEEGIEITPGVIPTTEVRALISEVNATARDWAQQRAAEMVGMKYVDGKLAENPNAKWRIDLATRSMLQRDITAAFAGNTPLSDLAATIRASGAFDQARADLIATTEVSNAQMRGNAEAWLKNGNVQEFKWQLSADHVCCDECDIMAINSPYPVGKVLELLDQRHPRCQCAVIGTKIKGVDL